MKTGRAILMAMARTMEELEQTVYPSLEELASLTETCGGEVVAQVTQLRPARDVALYLGRGKIDEIRELGEIHEAELLIADEELTGSQIRNLEEATGLRVLDRTFLILDIFAGRARSREGCLQVELAQLEYRSSRLSQDAGALSRLGGGIGTRGPGESKLETDRRHIRRRVTQLKKELAEVEKHRQHLRASRRRRGIWSAAVVGYTNAGKTTLVNALCRSDLEAMDQLFATLDPAVRRLNYSREDLEVIRTKTGKLYLQGDPLLVDTVGFIRRLPHSLVKAFRSTLQEAAEADLLLHVMDAGDPHAYEQFEVANHLLDELGAGQIPKILVLNQVDRAGVEERAREIAALLRTQKLIDPRRDTICFTSAKSGEGMENLRFLLLERAMVQPPI